MTFRIFAALLSLPIITFGLPQCPKPNVLPFKNKHVALAYVKLIDQCFYNHFKTGDEETGFTESVGGTGYLFNDSTEFTYNDVPITGFAQIRAADSAARELFSLTSEPYDHEVLSLLEGGYGVYYKSKLDMVFNDPPSKTTVESFTKKVWFDDGSGIVKSNSHSSSSPSLDSLAKSVSAVSAPSAAYTISRYLGFVNDGGINPNPIQPVIVWVCLALGVLLVISAICVCANVVGQVRDSRRLKVETYSSDEI
eukprot:7033_1